MSSVCVILPVKFSSRFMESSGVLFPSLQTYYDTQRQLLCPSVEKLWTEQREENIAVCNTQPQVHLAGDAR